MKPATTSRSPRPKGFSYQWELILLLWGTFFLNQADRQIFNVVMPLIKADLGLSDTQMGLAASLIVLTLAVFAPLAGLAGDQYSRKNLLLFSTTCWAGASLFMGWSSLLPMLILWRCVAAGGGEAFYGPPAFALIGVYHRKTRGLAMAIHQTAIYAGVVSAGYLAGYLGEQFGWRVPFLLSGGLGLFMSALLLWRLQKTPGRKAGGDATPIDFSGLWQIISRSRVVIALSIGFAGLVFSLIGYLTWMTTFLHEEFDLTLGEAGFHAMFWHHLAAMIGVLLGGKVSDNWAIRWQSARIDIQIFALLAGIPFLIWMAWAPGLLGVCLGLAGFGFFRGIYDSNIFAAMYDFVPAKFHATIVGFMTLVAFFVAALAPVIMGALKDQLGLRPGISLLSLGFLIGGLVILFVAKPAIQREWVGAE